MQRDANRANAVRELLASRVSTVDLGSFQLAAKALGEEGYKPLAIDADIETILRQIDAVLSESPTSGSIEIKLIREDA